MLYYGITVVRYSLAILCGISTITILWLLHKKKNEFYIKYVLSMLSVLFCLVVVDFICFRISNISSHFEKITNWNQVACIADLLYYLLIGLWILLLGKLTEKGTVISEKVFFFVFVAAGSIVEGLLHFFPFPSLSTVTFAINGFIICYASFYVINSIRNYSKLKPRGIAVLLSILLLVYTLVVLYGNYTVYSALLKGLKPPIPHNPLVEVAFLFEIVILIYFKKSDPLELKGYNNIEETDVEHSVIEAYKEKYQLTSREMDVFRLIVDGRTTPQISQELYLSESTVKKHITNIFKKMNISNRYELIIKVLGSDNAQNLE